MKINSQQLIKVVLSFATKAIDQTNNLHIRVFSVFALKLLIVLPYGHPHLLVYSILRSFN